MYGHAVWQTFDEHKQVGSAIDMPAKRRVLVVDDSRLERHIVAASLRKWGYDVDEAEDGGAALEQCSGVHYDFVLSDWMMPGLSGPEFCQAFRALPGEAYSYFILLTSKREATEVAHGLNAGADDFLTKPVSTDELRARMTAGDRILRMQGELSDKNKVISNTLAQLQKVYDKIDADLVQARKIQQSLVPQRDAQYGANSVNLLFEPCGHIGGDLVGMFSPGRNRLGLYSIDVSGHGITSAMMTARLGSYLSSDHWEQNAAMELRFERFYALRQPRDLAALLNTRLNADAGIEEYFTMVYAIVDLRSGLVRLVQAGHPHPFLLRRSGEVEVLGNGGLPIGLIPDISFEQIEFQMSPGDRLLLYSDGLTECSVEGGRMLEEKGLLDLIQGSQRREGRALLDDVFQALTRRMTSPDGMEDDMSATLFEYQGPEPEP